VLFRSQGIELLHINERDDIDLWKGVIKNKLGLNQRIYARKTHVKEASNKEATEFLIKNHLQGKCISKYKLGLYGEVDGEEQLCALMTFGKARYSKADFELIRFCSLSGFTVVGGASKLIKAFRTSNPGSIVSYANKRWSIGNVYEKLGFTYLHDSPPCYWYMKSNTFSHRSTFMKHKLAGLVGTKLDTFDPDKTEIQNMYENSYRRIWDSGNKVYILD
jgi:hypothetical protein